MFVIKIVSGHDGRLMIPFVVRPLRIAHHGFSVNTRFVNVDDRRMAKKGKSKNRQANCLDVN